MLKVSVYIHTIYQELVGNKPSPENFKSQKFKNLNKCEMIEKFEQLS